MCNSKSKNYDSHVQEEWLNDEKYKYWVKKDKDPTKAYCILCLKYINVSRKGKGNLDEHARGKKHMEKVLCSKQKLLTIIVKEKPAETDKSQNQHKK